MSGKKSVRDGELCREGKVKRSEPEARDPEMLVGLTVGTSLGRGDQDTGQHPKGRVGWGRSLGRLWQASHNQSWGVHQFICGNFICPACVLFPLESPSYVSGFWNLLTSTSRKTLSISFTLRHK